MMDPFDSESHVLELFRAADEPLYLETLTPYLTIPSWTATRPDRRGGSPNALVIKARWTISPKVMASYFPLS